MTPVPAASAKPNKYRNQNKKKRKGAAKETFKYSIV